MDEHEGQVESTKCSNAGVITFACGLVAGTFSALLCKMSYDTTSVGLDGNEKHFAKPIMMLLLMFSAMAPALLFWLFQQYFFVAKEDRDVVTWKTALILVVPSLCDLLCTLLLLVAQLYITASMWQMLRGSVICITALLKRFLLGHRLQKHMWIGVGIITFAMVLVASTSFFDKDPKSTSNKDPRVGVLLVILGCLAQGVQYVFEEKVMAVDNAPPLVVIGCEGLWGTVLTLVIVYPLAYVIPGQDNGSFEDPWDALHMIQANTSLQGLLIGFVITVTIYNCMVIYVTKYLSAIWHAILDNFRPITIWALDLCIFYFILPGKGFGEKWVNASWLQLGGLLFLFFGTFVYDGRVPLFNSEGYEAVPLNTSNAAADKEVEFANVQRTPIHMSSPALTRSPMVYPKGKVAIEDKGTKYRTAQLKATTYNEI